MLDDPASMGPDEHRAAVLAIQRNAERMQHFVADLLTLAQLESGELRLSPKPLDLATLVPGARLPSRRYEGDEELLGQLFATVVGVAHAAADPGAAVDVDARDSVDGWTLTARTDTAEPVTPERLLSIRLNEDRTGTIALLLAREIAARHGGHMTITTEPSLTFTVHLP